MRKKMNKGVGGSTLTATYATGLETSPDTGKGETGFGGMACWSLGGGLH